MVEMLIMGTCRVSCTVFFCCRPLLFWSSRRWVLLWEHGPGRKESKKFEQRKKNPGANVTAIINAINACPFRTAARGGCLRGTHSGRDNANVVEDNKIPSRMGLDSCATMAGDGGLRRHCRRPGKEGSGKPDRSLIDHEDIEPAPFGTFAPTNSSTCLSVFVSGFHAQPKVVP